MLKVSDSLSIADLLLATLASGRNTRRFRSILNERKFEKYNESSLSVTLTRLHTKKYVIRSSSGWSLTQTGILAARNKKLLSYFPSPFSKNSKESVIIAFDIPEPNRVLRTWLRNQIKIFGYKMLQQSLWLGPGPLPKNFLQRLEDLKIRKNIKIFSKVKKLS